MRYCPTQRPHQVVISRPFPSGVDKGEEEVLLEEKAEPERDGG
jgi:hypothetical protein